MGTRPFDPSNYGPIIAALLSPERLPELGPGQPDISMRGCLAALDSRDALGRVPVDNDMARACISAIWLYFGFLDESHKLSQTIETPTGAYWHGLMHRREPDFDNSKYWFGRVGSHPVFVELAAAARRQAERADVGAAGGQRLRRTGWLNQLTAWDAFAFIDTCRDCIDVPGPDHDLCRRISLVEWQLLFDYSYARATGIA